MFIGPSNVLKIKSHPHKSTNNLQMERSCTLKVLKYHEEDLYLSITENCLIEYISKCFSPCFFISTFKVFMTDEIKFCPITNPISQAPVCFCIYLFIESFNSISVDRFGAMIFS